MLCEAKKSENKAVACVLIRFQSMMSNQTSLEFLHTWSLLKPFCLDGMHNQFTSH